MANIPFDELKPIILPVVGRTYRLTAKCLKCKKISSEYIETKDGYICNKCNNKLKGI